MNDNSNFRFRLVELTLLLLLLCSSAMAKIIYVDDDAVGANNGSSWIDAYNYLQDALADANTAEKPVEIRVAQGTYTPDRGMTQTLGDREATFRLINGVAICGGYVGHAESDPNDRDSDLYMSILSGDLEGNDVEAERLFDIALDSNTRGRGENSKHVLIGSFTDETAVLDGFTITGGFGARRDYIIGGAGIDIESGSPTIANCVFTGNASFSSTSALVNRNGSCPNLTNCTFSKNCSSDGTMENYQSSPILTYCRFSNNSDDVIRNRDNSNPMLVDCTFENNFDVIDSQSDCNVTLTNCIFLNNSSCCIDHTSGGRLSLTGCVFRDNSDTGIDSRADELTLTDCLFVHNISSFSVSAIDHYGDNLTLENCEFRSNSGLLSVLNVKGPDVTFIAENCIFSGNIAKLHGFSIEASVKNSIISNCLFAGNVGSEWGGVIHAFSNGNITIQNCTFSGNTAGDGGGSLSVWNKTKVTNCIFWGENSPVIQPQYNEPLISYSNVQGGWPGEGNIDVDPYFVSPGYWDQNGTPDDTSDDFWVDGDYHLKSQAGRWDPVSESWVIDDVTSPCIDAGDPNSPVAFEPFPNGGIINMGAYGGSSQAGMSPSGFHAKYGGGAGEPNDPYMIYTSEQMNTIGAEPNDWDKHFKLMADIDLKDFGDSSFNLIGNDSHPFKGVFDGNGHTISNLTYIIMGYGEPAEDDYIARFGLFRSVDDPNAMIRDLRLVNPEIRPASTCGKSVFIVGALVGYLRSGFVSNCRVEGGQVRGEHGIGGLAGSNWGTVSDCYTTCMVGPAEQRSLPNVDEPLNRREFFGGLVGVNFREISNCHAVGEVSGEWSVGGLVGEAYGSISNSWSGGDVSGDFGIGGLIGMTRRQAQISNCYATGHISGRRSVGGLVGYSLKESSINSCYATGSVSAEQEAGGLVGLHEGTLSECCSTAPVSAASDTAGGLVGFNGGKIFTSWASGEVTGGSNIGGLVGENKKWSQLIAGKLFEYDGIVVHSYAKGSVYGEDAIGGLVGDNSGTVLGSYSTGRVTGQRNFGGLVGISGDVPVLGSFWDTETSGLDTSSGGIGKTTAEMQTAGTFLEAGWDFVDKTANGTEDIWWILEGQDYPRLRWELIESRDSL